MRWLFILTLVLLVNAGCSGPTPYQKATDYGGLGYSDYQVKDNIYHVSVTGVPGKDKGIYLDYWHRRAKELCEGMGSQEYRIIEVKEDEGDPTPERQSAVPYDLSDPRYKPREHLKYYSRPASVSGEVECLKKSN